MSEENNQRRSKKALIIGGGGFVGKHLTQALIESGRTVYVTKLEEESLFWELNVRVCNLDILNRSDFYDLIRRVNPREIYHLAAISSASLSWKEPRLTMETNILGSLNLLEALRELGCPAKVLMVGSGEEYGLSPNAPSLKESDECRPQNPYAVSKLAVNQLTELYAKAYSIDIVSARAFNHIGPGQSPQFVASDFARQIALIEKGKTEPVIRVGNLGAQRDFTDVRDVTKGYIALMEKGVRGKTYNVGGGSLITVRELLDTLISFSEKEVTVEVDQSKLRPIEAPIISPDTSLIRGDTGWTPSIPLRETLLDTLNYWRKEVSLI